MRRLDQVPLIAMAIVILIGLSGCGEDRTAGAPADPTGDGAEREARFLASPSPTAVALSVPAPVSKLIKAKDGGELAIGPLKIVIPKGALSADATLELTLIHAERVSFRVEPADLAISLPIQMKVEHLSTKTDHRRFAMLRFFRTDGSSRIPLATERDGELLVGESDTLGEFVVGIDSDADDPIQFLRYLSGPGYQTELIEASSGGDVQYNRYKVKIPKHALSEDTYITVRDPGTGYVMCDLEPHGIAFLVPVQFEMDLTGLRWQPYTDWTDYWFNEETGDWERQSGTFDGKKIVDSLSHFSRYAAGRAGW